MFENFDIVEFLLTALAVIITLTVHEFFHGYAAYKLGDNTAKNMGRLSLNPIHHIDPIGAVCLLFFHVGWAKPVPVNPRNFKNPKKGFAITALCGPLSNLIMAFLFSGVALLLYKLSASLYDPYSDQLIFRFVSTAALFFSIFFSINIGLAIFNLLPVPPLDGSRLLAAVLPEKTYFAIMKYERKIYLVLLAWLILGDVVATFIRTLFPALGGLATVFSLSELLGYAINFIGGLFIKFWQLIPALRF